MANYLFDGVRQGRASRLQQHSEDQQKAWREKRQRDCLKRKNDLLKKLSKKFGKDIKAVPLHRHCQSRHKDGGYLQDRRLSPADRLERSEGEACCLRGVFPC